MIDEIKIMQYADGTLPIEEREEVKKAIETDPKLKELYHSFIETGDKLFKLGNEIKSQPLPKNLQEKAEVLKSWKKPVKEESSNLFNFFGLFKMQNAGIAAAFCLFFVGGFFTNTFFSKDNTELSNNDSVMIGIRGSDKVKVPEKLKMRSLPSHEEDLSTRIQNIYRFFEEKDFINEIDSKLENLEINEQFQTNIEDDFGKKIKFTLLENLEINEKNCKKITFSELIKLSNIDEGTAVILDLCKVNDNYELTSINISK